MGIFSSAGRAFQTRHVSKEAAARAPAISRSVAFLSGAESRRRRRSAGALRAATVSSTAATAVCRYSCSRSSSASRPAFGALPKRSSPAPRQAAFQAVCIYVPDLEHVKSLRVSVRRSVRRHSAALIA